MSNIAESLSTALVRVFKQRKFRHIVDWADTYFELPAESSNSSSDSRWRTFGYQRFVLHAFADLDTEVTAVCKPVQVGLTKCALIAMFYDVVHRFRTTGYWIPRRADRDEFVNGEVEPILQNCDEIGNELRVPVGKKDPLNTSSRKAFKGGRCYFRGTQKLQDVSSVPIASGYMDELSKMVRMIKDNKDDVGKSPVDGVRGRFAAAEAPKLNLLSTPTEAGNCQITEQFLACREKFFRFYQCECGHWQCFEWGDEKTRHGFKWVAVYNDRGDRDNLETAKTVYYQCANCDHQFKYKELQTLDDERGEWRTMDYDEDENSWSLGDIKFNEVLRRYESISTGEVLESPHSVGIQIRGWMSRRKKWKQIAFQYLEAVKDLKSGKPAKMADFDQDVKGEAHAAASSQDYVRHGYLMHKQEQEPDWGAEIPDWVQCITAWWDVQGDRIEGLVKGWGFGEESCLIEHVVKWGDADATDVLENVRDLTRKTYTKASGFQMPILMSGIDARHKTDAVNEICSGAWKDKIIPTYGNRNVFGTVIAGQTKTKKKRDNYGITVCTNAAKEIVYSRYKIEVPGPGYIHIPQKLCFPEAFIKQMCVERKGMKANDPQRWEAPEGHSNEGTDLMAGNLAIVMLAQQKFRLRFLPPHEYTDIIEDDSGMTPEEETASAWA